MSVFLLTWNPDGRGWPSREYEAAVARISVGGPLRADVLKWSVGARKSGIEPGDRGFLMRQRHERGIVAAGTFSGSIFASSHWTVRFGRHIRTDQLGVAAAC